MSNALRIAHGRFGRVALLDMDASLVRHAHPHCHVLIKAEGADTHFMVRDQLVPLTANNAVLINAWEPHAYVHDPSHPRTVILAFYIEPGWLSGFRRNWGASAAPGFFERHSDWLTAAIRRRANELAAVLMAAPDAGEAQEALISELMIAVIERYAPWRSTMLRDFEPDGRVDYRIRRALISIRGNSAGVTDMTCLAREVGLSRTHFFRLFGRTMDISPRVFLNTVRMETAVAEVMDGDTGMAEVSDRLGFSAPAHFTRFFRDHAGAPPREFRAIARLNAPHKIAS
ncbi:MAG: AraC family transcriptional regulator [Alphaproteobacteria bacterium]|nr:AraC family transcriptional regulator [Alphaproteobacteria bacterium]